MTLKRVRTHTKLTLAFVLAGLFAAGCSNSTMSETDLDNELGSIAPDAAGPKAAALPSGQLRFSLKQGDRFPLVKTVDQRLFQGAGAAKQVGASSLELVFAVMVQESRQGATKFQVQYDRVRFHEVVGDTQSSFDSTHPTGPLPPAALAYSGLAGNSFSFWMGSDNKILELVDFPQFLERCMQSVPAQDRQRALAQLANLSSEDSLSNFIDDSLGLLPSHVGADGQLAAVHEGSTWTLPPRTMDGPVPLVVSTRCLLKSLTEREASLDIQGRIGPVSSPPNSRGYSMLVRGGECRGSCVIDRATGLPTNTRIERQIDLVVQTPDRQEIPQRKEILTTVQTFPEQIQRAAPRPDQPARSPIRDGQVAPAGFRQ